MTEIREAVLVDYARTPFGLANSTKIPGFFADRRADDLATVVVHALLKRTGIDPASVDEVIFGAANQGGEQASPGRMVGLMTCPPQVAGLSVDRACGSSTSAVHIAAMAIQLNLGDIFICGGLESHSHYPTPLITEDTDIEALAAQYVGKRHEPNPRIFDNIDIGAIVSMGLTAEKLAEQFGLTREDHDQWAHNSYSRAALAQREGKFKHEIIPMEATLPDGTTAVVDYDQGIRPNSNIEKIRSLPPLYKADGMICASSTSGENDGAAAMILMAKEKAKELGLVPMATIKSLAWVGVDPSIMGYGAVVASKKALHRCGLSADDIDLYEVNEAFATLPLVQIKDMGIDPEKMNVNGGALCIGHPTGVSGLRILGTLAYETNRRGSKYGLASICGGWGAGVATVIERQQYWEGRRAFLS